MIPSIKSTNTGKTKADSTATDPRWHDVNSNFGVRAMT
jgi:hypothetical protein